MTSPPISHLMNVQQISQQGEKKHTEIISKYGNKKVPLAFPKIVIAERGYPIYPLSLPQMVLDETKPY